MKAPVCSEKVSDKYWPLWKASFFFYFFIFLNMIPTKDPL